MMIYVQLKFHEILFIGHLVMTQFVNTILVQGQ